MDCKNNITYIMTNGSQMQKPCRFLFLTMSVVWQVTICKDQASYNEGKSNSIMLQMVHEGYEY